MSHQVGNFSSIDLKKSVRAWESEQSKARGYSLAFVFAKRCLDVSLSLFVIVFILSWAIPLLALCIRLESKGSPFFSQERTGKGGKTFTCYKLRTMRRNEEANTRQASDDDDRITRFGKYLRLSSLDEIPQFFNVLKGDMSLVGPRPHMVYHTDLYSNQIPYYNLRHKVKPGITGLAQVKGLRGPTADLSDMELRVQNDLYYIAHGDMEMDLAILQGTAKEVWRAVIS